VWKGVKSEWLKTYTVLLSCILLCSSSNVCFSHTVTFVTNACFCILLYASNTVSNQQVFLLQ
jgi:hypothetical protein